jgi:predicted acetyltransferase
MSMKLRWAGRESIDTIADARMRCYGNAPADRAVFLKRTENDRFADGDVLLMEDGGAVVGTATHLSLELCVRGGRVPCQGVAWVGTVRSHRRRRVNGQGIASTVVNALLDRARERGDVATALMPFRSSFYEHFGYGTVERQNQWTVPLSILPPGDTDGFRLMQPTDRDAMAACRSRQALAGQCDVDGGTAGIAFWMRAWPEAGFTYVDQPVAGGAITGFVTVQLVMEGDRAIALVKEPAFDSPAALMRILAFLGNLRDQYSEARIHLPVDLPLPWLLKERQVAHRRIDHPAARCSTINRMQLRVLDHARFVAAIRLAPGPEGRIVVVIRESEGGESRLSLELAGHRVSASTTDASPDVTLSDATWSAVVTGALPASDARAFGLLETTRESALHQLDRFAVGPTGFCWEYF